MDKRSYSITKLLQSASPTPRPLSHRFNYFLPRIALWLVVVLLLAACGPGQPKVDSSALAATTARIAQDFAANSNLDQARAAIDALEVANPHQYLVLQAEEAISANQDPQAASALVKLAVALRLNSGSIQAYAVQNGIVSVPPTEPPVPTLDFGPSTPAPSVVQADSGSNTGASAAPAVAAAPAAVTGTEPVSATVPLTNGGALAAGTPAPVTAAAAATSSGPSASSAVLVNVRNGPGVDYPVVDSLDPGEAAAITGKSSAGDWWQVALGDGQAGWVMSQLVTASGDTANVTVPADIPTPPPTATPAPIADAPAADASATAAPAGDATATPAPPAASPSDQPYFKLVASRMWAKSENGDCRGQHLLRINVIDANGVRLNGVRLKGIYTGEEIVTGSQGKGDGIIEYDLYGTGEGFTVIKNDDGRDASSDRAEGFTTQSREISKELLIAGGYCTNDADCQIFYDSWGCNGHHSWEATFQRNY
ncbi:MAG: SH3 domain-containing protein [Caldilineaceae bacterium]